MLKRIIFGGRRALVTVLLTLSLPGLAGQKPVRFVAFGDGGSGAPMQYMTAKAMGEVCALRGCDFGLMLGDNIYVTGVESANDPQFESKFEAPYAPLKFPIYAVLGNHDTGGDGAQNSRGDFQVAYHYRKDRSTDRWRMPARFYSFTAPLERDPTHALVEFFALDSTPFTAVDLDLDPKWDPERYGPPHLRWLQDKLAQSRAPWKIALAHHPYVSNGRQGNAGEYTPWRIAAPTARGRPWKEFLDAGICNRGVDLYLSGHDHDLQWLRPVPACGKTEFIVSGAVAGPARLGNERRNPAFYNNGKALGFFWIEITETELTGVVYELTLNREKSVGYLARGADGNPAIAFQRTFTRQP
ncbi:MAG TPA: metallophosphoesterase [Solimonas sp.]|nr:metallophosphoesterase [Solimonas sp.]